MPAVTINYLAVLVTGIISMIIGMLWYSPALFGKVWMKMVVLGEHDQAAAKKAMARSTTVALLAALVMTYVLAHIVGYTQASTFTGGMQTGFWVWLGFYATSLLGVYLWERKPFNLYLLNAIYYLFSLVIIGG